MAIQATGSIASIFIVLAVASRFGPEGQGYWAAYRSVLDMLVALAVYGFPQGFTYVINRMNVLPHRTIFFALRYLGLAWPLIAGTAVIALANGWIRTGGEIWMDATTLVLAGIFTAAHGLLRGIVLAASQTLVFNLVTAIPVWLQLAFVLGWPEKQLNSLPLAIVASSLLSLVICAGIAKRDLLNSPINSKGSTLNRRYLVEYGFWWCLVALLQAIIPLALYQLLLERGYEVSIIGSLSVALLVIGAGLLPFSMVGPLIFNGLTKAVKESERQQYFIRTARWLMIAAITCTLMIVIFLPQLMSIMFDDRFAEATSLAVVMLVSMPAAYYTRLVGNMMTSSGEPQKYVLLLTFRVVCTIIPCILIDGGPRMMASFYAFGEIAAAGCAGVLLRRVNGWKWRSIMLMS